jgi:hypothetical protein
MVRIHLDAQFKIEYGQLAQLVRAFARHAKGHWFESSIAHKSNRRFLAAVFYYSKIIDASVEKFWNKPKRIAAGGTGKPCPVCGARFYSGGAKILKASCFLVPSFLRDAPLFRKSGKILIKLNSIKQP